MESEQTGTPTFKGSPRKEASKSVSDGAHTSMTQGEDADGARARKSKGSQLFSKLFRVLVPCVGPSSRAHPVDLDEKPKAPPPAPAKPVPKDAAPTPSALKEKQAEELPPAPQEPPAEPSAAPEGAQASTAEEELPSPLQPIDIPQQPDDPNVLVPPTPTKTLPREETEGMTSGAVQPPGSGPRAEDSLHNHSRRSSRILGEETDGSTSFTDDEDIEDGTPIDEVEDEEERLIMQGGAGIPIGPVSSFLRSCRRYIIRRLRVAGRCSKTITTPSIT